MKTIDEVIETAPYVGTEWTNNALHYLKELKEARAILATAREESKKQIDAIRISTINSMANQCESCPWRKNENVE